MPDALEEQTSVRLPKGSLRRLDRLAAAMGQHPVLRDAGPWGRGKALRAAVAAGLDALEEKYLKKGRQ